VTVIDASAFIEVLLVPGVQPAVEEAVAAGTTCAPAVFDAEVLSRLVKNFKRGLLSGARMQRALDDLVGAPIQRVPHQWLLHDAWRRSAALSAYDALYVALAAHLRVGLVTTDQRLAGAPQLGVPVTVIPRASAN
jgi:predicted nucleic acid-binding protein